MNAKKAGLVTAGVVAAVLAVSPLAWAADEPTEAPENCSFSQSGDDVFSGPDESGSAQNPQASNNQGVYGECSTFGQNNNQDNGVGNTFNDQEVPELPAFPIPGIPSGGPSDLSAPGLPSGGAPGLSSLS